MRFAPFNFGLVAVDIDTKPLLEKIEAMPGVWSENTLRQEFEGSPHHDTEAIFLRGPAEISVESGFNEIESVDYPKVFEMHKEVTDIVSPILRRLQVRDLGRVMIVRLKPGGVIDEHIDEGPYAEHYARFHVVLSSEPGNSFTVDGETKEFTQGECWWFNHRKLHNVRNDSASPRVHLIFDAVSPQYANADQAYYG